MRKLIILFSVLLLTGCADKADLKKVDPAVKVEATDPGKEVATSEDQVVEEVEKEVEVTKTYTESEAEDFKLKLVDIEALTIEYLYNTKSDIYICGKLCDDQPLTDIQLSMDVSRNGLSKAAQQMSDIVSEIESFANSGTPGIVKEDMQRVANQFKKSSEEIGVLLAKENWSSWREPGESIDRFIAELEETSWLYKPYSPAIDAEEGAKLEAEAAISGAIVEIMYARDELQKSYDFQLEHLREQPIELDGGGYAKASASYLLYTDQYIDLIIDSADRALQYEMDNRLSEEFESAKVSAELIRTGIGEYNGYVEEYKEPFDFESLMNNWHGINKAIDKIENGLYLKTYEMEMYQDFVNY